METKKKQLLIPLIPDLDTLNLELTADVLVEKGFMQSIASANWSDQYAYKPLASFSMARSKSRLYIRFLVNGNCLRAICDQDQGAVEEDSCVGVVVQNPLNHRIYDFAFNCIGSCKAFNKEAESESYMKVEQLTRIQRFSDLGHRPFCEVEGMFNWQLVVSIPFSCMGLDGAQLPDELMGNLYKRADASALPHYLSWAPIHSSDIHFDLPSFFGVWKFSE